MSLPPSRQVALRFGDYRPCLEIGSGGMATVYIAKELESSGLQRTVALKVMHEHLARTERYKKRFLDEARILSRLTHPFVCRVFGYGEDADGRPFMAMEYLVGEPLSRVLRAVKHQAEGLSSEARARLFGRVMADMAEGIHSAHETRDNEGKLLGVVHRDVSPQNLFMMYDGTVRIVDFGIAWYRDRYVQTATTSRLIGKLPYMAPEQVQGEGYDRRVDVWALGVVLWELVTLERLFRRATEVHTMEAVCFDPIPLVSDVVSGLPVGFDQIVSRALQRDPAKRYQTARELAHDLEVWLASTGKPVTHGDVCNVLTTFFPGSEEERRRWAEAAPHSGSRGRVPQVDFASEALEALENDTPASLSLSLPQRMIREDDLVSTEFTPPPQFQRRVSSTNILELEDVTHEVNKGDLFSAPPPTNATPVAISVREPATTVATAPAVSLRLWLGILGGSLLLGFLAFVVYFGRSASVGNGSAPVGVAALPVVLSQPATDVIAPAPRAVEEPLPEEENRVVVANARGAEASPAAPATLSAPSVAPAVSAAVSAPSAAAATASVPPAASAQASHPSARPLAAAVPAKSTVSAAASSTDHTPTLGSGDVLIVSATPGVNVYLGSKFIGQTPLRTRLPVGPAQLSVQVGSQGSRSPITTQVAPGRLNIVSLK